MSYTVELSDSVFLAAQHFAQRAGRSVSEQFDIWSTVASLAEEHPDLPYGMIADIAHSKQEMASGQVMDYVFENE